MTRLLLKLFVRDYKNIQNSTVRGNYGKLSGAVGISTNVLLFLFKIVTGLVAGSIAIVADAANNLADAASSVVTLIGFKLSGKPADEEHPYGHARIEYIVGLIVSFLVLFLGGQLVLTSAGKIFSPETLDFSLPAALVLVGAVLLKLWLCLFYRKIAKMINSVAIMAVSKDSRNDVIASSVVLFSGIFFAVTGINVDGYAGLLVAVFIIFSGISLLKETVNPLLGIMPDAAVVDKIKEKILQYENVIGLHDLVIHSYGYDRMFASVHVEMPAEHSILDSHDIIDNIEKDFIRNENINLVIHLDPVVTDNAEVNRLSAVVDGILKEIDPVITKHDFRVSFGAAETKLIFDIDLPPKFHMTDNKITDIINKKIKKHDDTLHAVIMIDRSYTSTVL